jgi:electron transfer flavoprotein beta subunit
VKLPDIMKAKRKPLETIPLGDLGIESGNDIEIGHHAPPPERSRGIMVEDAAQLVTELKNRGLV